MRAEPFDKLRTARVGKRLVPFDRLRGTSHGALDRVPQRIVLP